MKMKTPLFLIVLAASSLSAPSLYAASSENVGTLNVTVIDENGALVKDAPIYIYGEHKTRFVGGKEIPGTATLTMPAGHYRISSAIVKKTGDYLDRYASSEAHVEVVAGDNTILTLPLKPIEDPLASLGYADAGRIGLPADLARNLN
jgi:hypothetical protein